MNNPKQPAWSVWGFSGTRDAYCLAALSFCLTPFHFYVSCQVSGIIAEHSLYLFAVSCVL